MRLFVIWFYAVCLLYPFGVCLLRCFVLFCFVAWSVDFKCLVVFTLVGDVVWRYRVGLRF